MNQSEYGKHRGISQQRVSQLIRDGHLKGAIKKIGGRWQIEPVEADRLLSENLDQGRVKSHTNDPAQEEQERTIHDAGMQIVSRSEADKIKANYDAALKKIEYQERSGEVVPVEDARKAFADLILTARGKILGIKGKLGPLIREFVEDPDNFGTCMDVVETEIREILTEMSQQGVQDE